MPTEIPPTIPPTIPPVIHSLLPFKEGYTVAHAGAVALNVRDGFTHSRYGAAAMVLGRRQGGEIAGKILGDVPYYGLPLKQAWLPWRLMQGRNIGLANAYLGHIRRHGMPALLEVHGRLQVAAHIGQRRPDLKMALWLHNDPRGMRGGATPGMRQSLLKRMAVIYCVSDYLRRCFMEGVDADPADAAKAVVIPIAAERPSTRFPRKERLITMTGRMVPEKGVLQAAQALAEVLPAFPDWSARLIGARHFEASGQKSAYEAAVADALEGVKNQAEMTGFISPDEKHDLQMRSAIVLVPSQWQEPAGRVVLEALAAGAALITTRRGGIPEYAEGRGVLLDGGDKDAIAAALYRMISDEAWREGWQKKAWDDYPFSVANMVKHLDTARDRALGVGGDVGKA